MDILVSGGAGFIGTNFIQLLLDKYPDYNVVCVDKLTYAGNSSNLERFLDNPRFHFRQIDICKMEELQKIFKFWYGFDIIVNFAAESHVDRSISSEFSRNFIDSNIIGTFNFLEIIKKYKVKTYVQVSTDEVYGSLDFDNTKFIETMNLKPSSLYSASKASADLIALSYFTTFKLPVVISRCSNNYGPYQHPEKFIPLMITNALEGKPLPIYGSGENIRDWINVLDHCRSIETIMHYGKHGEVYNAGGGNEARNIDVAKFILDYLGLSHSMIENVGDRLGHDLRYSMDYSKIESELGWKPKFDFKEGLIETIEWYVDNKSWWKPLKESNV